MPYSASLLARAVTGSIFIITSSPFTRSVGGMPTTIWKSEAFFLTASSRQARISILFLFQDVADLFEQELLLRGRRGRYGRLHFLAALKGVHSLDHHEDHEGDDDEIDDV